MAGGTTGPGAKRERPEFSLVSSQLYLGSAPAFEACSVPKISTAESLGLCHLSKVKRRLAIDLRTV